MFEHRLYTRIGLLTFVLQFLETPDTFIMMLHLLGIHHPQTLICR